MRFDRLQYRHMNLKAKQSKAEQSRANPPTKMSSFSKFSRNKRKEVQISENYLSIIFYLDKTRRIDLFFSCFFLSLKIKPIVSVLVKFRLLVQEHCLFCLSHRCCEKVEYLSGTNTAASLLNWEKTTFALMKCCWRPAASLTGQSAQ